MKRFEYSPLGKKLKAETEIAKKQYQKLDDIFEFNRIIKRGPKFKNYDKSNQIYQSDLITFLSNQSICFYTKI